MRPAGAESLTGAEPALKEKRPGRRKPSGELLLSLEAIGKSTCQQMPGKLHTWLEAAREEERVRIARELHDELGGMLMVLKLNIDGLKASRARPLSHVTSSIEKMGALVEETIEVMRRLIGQLRPPALDQLGLPGAIKLHIRQFQEQTGLPCLLAMADDEFALDPARSVAVFRVLQESLTNVAKHASASTVRIMVRKTDNGLLLQVQDDGKGFDPRVCKNRAFGLSGIHERASLAGGRASIQSSPGKGSKVVLRVPWNEDRSRSAGH